MGIIADASPYSTGAILCVNGVPDEYFGIELTDWDEWVQKTPRWANVGQQVWESLVQLIALRYWAPRWKGRRVVLTVQGDNMTALAMVASLKSKGPALATIARELALDFASATYAPDIIQHTPGIMNSSADALSRRFEPDKNYVVPHILRSCKEVCPQSREPKCWKTWDYWRWHFGHTHYIKSSASQMEYHGGLACITN